MPPTDIVPMSLGQAARSLGLSGGARALRRRLVAAENRTSTRIMSRINGKERTRYTVTLRAVRRACPEWFRCEDELDAAERQRELLAKARAEFDMLRSICDEHSKKIGVLVRTVSSIRATLDRLGPRRTAP